MYDVILFGGTTEGRELAEFLSKQNISTLVCVATAYGETLLHCKSPIHVRSGRLNTTEMIALLNASSPRLVIDATHPYATQISANLQYACTAVSQCYVRVLRERIESEGCVVVPDMDTLVAWLNQMDGVIFAAIGAKEARALTGVKNFAERIVLRMLPSPKGIEVCMAMGYPMKHLICMQGPFSEAMNAAMFQEVNARILVTKESGKNGGFSEKLEAAKACDMKTVILARPSEESGLSLNQVKALLLEVCI